ncbi:hypothetical protein Celaphus_00019024, partial [Cervus elaphus hippelaphus]
MDAFILTAANEDDYLYTFNMYALDRPVIVHIVHVSVGHDVDYSTTGKSFVSAKIKGEISTSSSHETCPLSLTSNKTYLQSDLGTAHHERSLLMKGTESTLKYECRRVNMRLCSLDWPFFVTGSLLSGCLVTEDPQATCSWQRVFLSSVKGSPGVLICYQAPLYLPACVKVAQLLLWMRQTHHIYLPGIHRAFGLQGASPKRSTKA